MTAPVEALPLVRRITEHAYQAGATLVTTLFSDDVATLQRFAHAPDESFDKASGWLFDGMAESVRRRRGAARDRRRRPVAAVGAGPGKGRARQPRPVDRLSAGARADRQFRHQLDDRVLCDAGLGDGRVSRTKPEDAAVARLWDAIFAASRVDGADPVAAWDGAQPALHAPYGLSERQAPTRACASGARHRP